MKLFQINVTANSGSTGRIAEGIGVTALRNGFESWIAWGRGCNASRSKLIRIGGRFDYLEHGLETRIFDNHGQASRSATDKLTALMEQLKPDIIHLQNIHGYFLNYPRLFDYLKRSGIPVVWTLHDCWAFTGHCPHFSLCGCDRWRTGCHHCPQTREYPASYLFDRSRKNYEEKKRNFTGLKNLHVVSVSHWLDQLVGDSFLKDQPRSVIHNGIDTETFAPSDDRFVLRRKLGVADDEVMLLGAAAVWSDRKGWKDFMELNRLGGPGQKIVLAGLTEKQKRALPAGIIGITRTESVKALAGLYSAADLFLNLTYEDSYPSTNLEAISCGTPCLTYRTGGSPESVTDQTGFVAPQGDLGAVRQIVLSVKKQGKMPFAASCREYALRNFPQQQCFDAYLKLYQQIFRNV